MTPVTPSAHKAVLDVFYKQYQCYRAWILSSKRWIGETGQSGSKRLRVNVSVCVQEYTRGQRVENEALAGC